MGIAEVVVGVISVALLFAVAYYRTKWLNASSTIESQDEKIKATEVEFVNKQKEEANEDRTKASDVSSRADAIDFLRNSHN